MSSGPSRSFFRVAIDDFLTVGTVFPSSRWAIERIADRLPDHCRAVVEYGAGDGRLTRELLRRLPPRGRLVAIELNEVFVKKLKRIGDPRLELIAGDVVGVSRQLRDIFPKGADAVVSGIPFSFLTPAERAEIVTNTRNGLRKGGRFVVYQNSPRMRKALAAAFGRVDLAIEPRNLPPYFLMVASR